MGTSLAESKPLLLFTSREVQESKNYENPTSTSIITSKTIFIIMINLFSISSTFKFEATWNSGEAQLIQSHANMNHVGT